MWRTIAGALGLLSFYPPLPRLAQHFIPAVVKPWFLFGERAKGRNGFAVAECTEDRKANDPLRDPN
jgi:hypothetical protein